MSTTLKQLNVVVSNNPDLRPREETGIFYLVTLKNGVDPEFMLPQLANELRTALNPGSSVTRLHDVLELFKDSIIPSIRGAHGVERARAVGLIQSQQHEGLKVSTPMVYFPGDVSLNFRIFQAGIEVAAFLHQMFMSNADLTPDARHYDATMVLRHLAGKYEMMLHDFEWMLIPPEAGSEIYKLSFKVSHVSTEISITMDFNNTGLCVFDAGEFNERFEQLFGEPIGYATGYEPLLDRLDNALRMELETRNVYDVTVTDEMRAFAKLDARDGRYAMQVINGFSLALQGTEADIKKNGLHSRAAAFEAAQQFAENGPA